MASGLLLDAWCEACGYRASNLALGANQAFVLGEEDGWLAVITACPRCRKLVDVTVTRREIRESGGSLTLVCPDCGQQLPQPAHVYPQLTVQAVATSGKTVFEGLPCPSCRATALTVRIVGHFS